MTDISVIVVSYNTRELLAECLQSAFSESAGCQCEVWVVDNGSTDGSAAMTQDRFPTANLIVNADNRGFACANNQALQQASGDFLLLLNSDAALMPGSLAALLNGFAAHEEMFIAGPCLRNLDESIQPSWGAFPGPLDEFLFQSFLFKILPTRFPYGRRVHPLLIPLYKQFQWVDWITGAAFMMRRQVYDTIGGLPEHSFMYGEDLEYCARAREHSFRVAYIPDANVRHRLGESARRDYTRWITNYTRATLSYYWHYKSKHEQQQAARWIIFGSKLRVMVWRIAAALRFVGAPEAKMRVAGYENARSLAQQFLIQPALALGQE